jgi:hypothetical protein
VRPGRAIFRSWLYRSLPGIKRPYGSDLALRTTKSKN